MGKSNKLSIQGFKAKTSKKNVKTRTPYKAVDEYEKEFKYKFAEMLGDMMGEYATTIAKQLGTKKINLTKAEQVKDVLNSQPDTGTQGHCGQAHFEI